MFRINQYLNVFFIQIIVVLSGDFSRLNKEKLSCSKVIGEIKTGEILMK